MATSPVDHGFERTGSPVLEEMHMVRGREASMHNEQGT